MSVPMGYQVIERVKSLHLDYPAVGTAMLTVNKQMVLAKISDGSIFVEPSGPNIGQPITFPSHDRTVMLALDGAADAQVVTDLLSLIARLDTVV